MNGYLLLLCIAVAVALLIYALEAISERTPRTQAAGASAEEVPPATPTDEYVLARIRREMDADTGAVEALEQREDQYGWWWGAGFPDPSPLTTQFIQRLDAELGGDPEPLEVHVERDWRKAAHDARRKVEAVSERITVDDRGNAVMSVQTMNDFKAAIAEHDAAKEQLAAAKAAVEVQEVRAHQSEVPVRVLTPAPDPSGMVTA